MTTARAAGAGVAPTPAAVFEIRHLHHWRSGRQILFDASFSIQTRSIYTIIGPSGSGKSTLLRLLNRLEEPPPGAVFFGGEDITTLEVLALRRRVGMVFQAPAMFAGSVAGNLCYGPALRGERLSEERVAAILTAVDLDPAVAGREALALSGGQAQRVAFARALVNEPEVLLLDEPTSALDPAAMLSIERLVVNLRARFGLTFVWVTHNMEQARRVGDYTLLLVNGRVADEGTTRHLMAPGSHHELVREFMAGELRGAGETLEDSRGA
ncbi:MAG: phosphate ABC transporter ATP-binding protein [Ardenticatenaceae bacterium]|nr:phosphate ABC transporter ATP-binding protein [Ardenticatenaceae bacterium]HBY92643.1 phosphate ABC transporter ATP-binding protein [Chloroflexota bacterium]